MQFYVALQLSTTLSHMEKKCERDENKHYFESLQRVNPNRDSLTRIERNVQNTKP